MNDVTTAFAVTISGGTAQPRIFNVFCKIAWAKS